MASLQGDTDKALELFKEAHLLNPRELDWNFEFALILRSEGQLQEAEQILDYCVRQAPERTKFSNLLNLIREQRKQQDAMKQTDPQRS
ncbi:MAG: tetratricopeptide repeat protein [Planctomycetaceae bacterium]